MCSSQACHIYLLSGRWFYHQGLWKMPNCRFQITWLIILLVITSSPSERQKDKKIIKKKHEWYLEDPRCRLRRQAWDLASGIDNSLSTTIRSNHQLSREETDLLSALNISKRHGWDQDCTPTPMYANIHWKCSCRLPISELLTNAAPAHPKTSFFSNTSCYDSFLTATFLWTICL